MTLLFDVGNTHTHIGLADSERVVRRIDIPTKGWFNGQAKKATRRFVRNASIESAVLCSVVPRATSHLRRIVRELWRVRFLHLNPRTLLGVGLDYPKPSTIGQDRLANAIAARAHYGTPVVVIDFGTAVTFDVVDRQGRYVGGIIAPGLSAMTDYLHEKTALLPRIRVREVGTFIGRSTQEAMLIGAVEGYRGLIRHLLHGLRRQLLIRGLFHVVATGGYARLIAAKLPEITAVRPDLTLEGLRLLGLAHAKRSR